MVLLAFILRIVLIWWVATLVVKTVSGIIHGWDDTDDGPVDGRHGTDAPPSSEPDVIHYGDIEDADFEELDE